MKQVFCALICSFIVSSNALAAEGKRVVVNAVSQERAQQQVQAVGSTEAIRSVVLYPAVGDRVTGVYFQPGDEVQAGDLLLELDSRLQSAALQEAQIQLADAERTLKRLEDSFAKGAIPKSERDDALTQRDLAKVALQVAKAELQDRQVRAPFSGVMGLTDVEVGDRITEQTAIASIDDISALYINFKAPEAAVPMLRDGASVTVVPWHTQKQLSADIAYMDSRIDAQNRTIRVKAKIANDNEQFIPGMGFRVNLNMQGQAYSVVPEAALLWGATGPYVWKSVDNKATRVDVKIAQRLSGRLLVSGDLNAGDYLIVEGVQSLRPQQSVRFEQPALARKE
ncbi:Co/Zn/Cd efflux system membrane fusion protein [Pseudoalteromonas sp. SW0106-04]|uniref:efflux RND transporter periplasmic adaptor subunit n=1 Tax=Pseudoalteromonas TaxID=53246 RepID=UPI0006C585F2|nr:MULTISPECIES: efflux RND transporter periplasmic adaptor subunit [Pseudoalteromonas]GAP76395.1 Co/Zn/Cd efflux system membrane fusion protein [Pseudoalteromonas sp. SW0106-04]